MALSTFLLTILAGIAGTVIMTATMYLYARLSKANTKVVHVLGEMLTGNVRDSSSEKRKMLTVGTIGHFAVGVMFSLLYFLLWNWGYFQITLIDSLIIGAVSGSVAIIGWKFYLTMHQNPPKASFKHYAIALLISHVVFGVVTVICFQIITDNPEFWYQMKEELEG